MNSGLIGIAIRDAFLGIAAGFFCMLGPGTAQAAVPGAPTGVAAVAGDSKALISFKAPLSDGGSPVLDYKIYAYANGSTSVALSRSGVTVLSNYSFTGLTNGVSYVFRVRARNISGYGSYSVASNSVVPSSTAASPTAPGAPTAVRAVAGNAQALVSFTAPASNGGSAILDYQVRAYAGGSTIAFSIKSGVTVTSNYAFTGLTNGESYTFKVRARNSVGYGPYSALSSPVIPAATATVPTAPTAVSAVAGNNQALVSFSAPASNGGSAILDYEVGAYANGAIAATLVRSGVQILSNYAFTGLSNGTAYTFKVRARNSMGMSPYSSASNPVTPQGSDVSAPSLTGLSLPATAASLTVSGISISATDNVAITGYFKSERATPPTAGSAGWIASSSTTLSTSHVFAGAGVRTLYAWAKDAAGNVSALRSASVTITLPGLSRIGTRLNGSGSEFYNKLSGAKFTPRGNNLVRLVNNWHSTFDVGRYNAQAADDALRQMNFDHYNAVRVFLNALVISGQLTEPGVDPAYMANVRDFLVRARNYGIYVELTTQWLPMNYYSIVAKSPMPANVDSPNSAILHQGYINGLKAYYRDIVYALLDGPTPLTAQVLSFDLWNELEFSAASAPFSLTSGTLSPADGGTYNLSLAASRQAAADNGAVHWVNELVSAIKSADPELLVGLSVFTPGEIGKSGYDGVQPVPNTRQPARLKALDTTRLDLLEVHAYPVDTSSISRYFSSAEIESLKLTKPRLIGEYGAVKSVYTDTTSAAFAMRDFQIASCATYGFQGWLFWTFDTTPAEQPQFWNLLDNLGAINGVLAPVARPDPCR